MYIGYRRGLYRAGMLFNEIVNWGRIENIPGELEKTCLYYYLPKGTEWESMRNSCSCEQHLASASRVLLHQIGLYAQYTLLLNDA